MLQYLGERPVRISGIGSVATWKDGRQTPDTVACLIEFPRARASYRATLASSFGGTYTVFQGSNSALFMKEARSWMVKEADSALLGWEVYARKESVHDETGIAMVADATKLLQAGKEPGKDGPIEPGDPAAAAGAGAIHPQHSNRRCPSLRRQGRIRGDGSGTESERSRARQYPRRSATRRFHAGVSVQAGWSCCRGAGRCGMWNQQRLRPERGAQPPSESAWGWGPTRTE